MPHPGRERQTDASPPLCSAMLREPFSIHLVTGHLKFFEIKEFGIIQYSPFQGETQSEVLYFEPQKHSLHQPWNNIFFRNLNLNFGSFDRDSWSRYTGSRSIP